MIKLAAFDLDGTLLNSNREVSKKDMETLYYLGAQNIIRVAATGRNLYSLKKVMKPDFPVDYVVFSSGAGLVDWESNVILFKHHLIKSEIQQVSNVFKQHQLSYTIHREIPFTHYMYLKKQNGINCDLHDYTGFYKEYLSDLNEAELPEIATQMIGLLNHDRDRYEVIRSELIHLKVVLTTSPINHSSLWVEVFNNQVSKANGVDWICKMKNIDRTKTFGIGNDFNDIDLLDFTQFSYLVSNGADGLKSKYRLTLSNNESGFSEAINQLLNS